MAGDFLRAQHDSVLEIVEFAVEQPSDSAVAEASAIFRERISFSMPSCKTSV
jgi:hypothetical protein